MSRADSRRGIGRERKVKELLEVNGWVVIRAAGSKGNMDLVAMRADIQRPVFIEVKSTIFPFGTFLPAAREELLEAAYQAGASCCLAWWPKGGRLQWVMPYDWPRTDSARFLDLNLEERLPKHPGKLAKV